MDYVTKHNTQILNQLQNLKPKDINLFHDDSIEENITIVARLDSIAQEKMQVLISELIEIDAYQYYYPLNQLHITILGEIDIETDVKLIKKAILNIVNNNNLSFRLQGIGSNKFVTSVTAYPLFDIHLLRDKLRKTIGQVGTDYTVHLSAYEKLGWINFMRYQHTPEQRLLDKFYSYKDTTFHIFKSPKIEVYRNKSRVLDPTKSKLLFTYLLY